MIIYNFLLLSKAELEDEQVMLSSQPKAVPQDDMENCFGFDDEEEEEPEEKAKPNIHILQSAIH